MHLMKSTDLALRLLMRLAVESGGTAPTTREVAAALGAAYTHMAKVVARLQHLGLVEARRGRGGGLELTVAGRAASVGAVVRTFEGTGDLAACVGDEESCPLNAACRLRGALRQAQEAFYASLDGVSVTDVVAAPTGPLLLAISKRPGDAG
ncbi:RrF2 family transcriptional regulator [Streptacidiphilus jiangxiensis]|uniref:Rrf2 family transcriptional regulator, nitric oxide-sensitive transcriptional repressor n=1 Tax=Streptacidiphilus jiangxiensis TaxID=235985 RepID=A0A1H7LW45_STRJI|nr:Rrf2 family transcriptional regulator [Streptacidiphilus jiangxiensis]SEL03161.1 Rrf2 family transcriptional regulator, nitric oxide-sensitive transcriptional repressor [Streptacidiphilus jiangxiensis]